MHLSHRLLRLRLRGNGLGTSRKFPRKWPAKTLYELLGVRPDDDAKTLQSAFRDAAKAHHPDLHPSDPHATWRFTQIATAYEILRNTEQRDAYDEMLALERERRRARLARIIVVVSDTVAIVALTAVIVGGYTLFAQMSKTSVEATKVVEPAAPTDTGLRGEPSGKSTRVELADAPIAPSAAALDKKSHEPLIMAQGDPVPDPAGSDSEVAKAVDALVAAVARGDMGNDADHQKRDGDPAAAPTGSNSEVAKAVDALVAAVARGDMGSDADHQKRDGDPAAAPTGSNSKVAKAVEALVAAVARGDMGSDADHQKRDGDPAAAPTGSNSEVAKAVDALVAAVNRGDMGSGADQHKRNDESHSLDQTRAASAEPQSSSSEKDKSPSSDLAIPDEKHDVRTSAKLRAHAKRPATDRTFVRQAAVESRDMSRAALESRNTSSCASSCSDRAPPLFGLGF